MRSPPDLQRVLDGLGDADCRRIIGELDEARTASEIADACDIHLSTVYRKLELLTGAGLVEERTRLRDGGHHTHEYEPAFESIQISLDGSQQFDISVVMRERTAAAQLTTIWTEIRETL